MTTTTYHGETAFDLGTLDERFEADRRADPIAGMVFGRGSSAPADADDLLLEADGRSLPDSVALTTIFWRSFLTLAPIIAADLLALAAAGLVARGALWLTFRSAADCVGWAAPLALLPLVIAYWLSDLYVAIWVHPVIELRQLTHTTSVGVLAAAAGGLLAPPFPIWCLVALPAAVALVPLFRTVARRLCADRSWWGYPTLIIGSGGAADGVARTLLRDTNSGLCPVLLTDPDGICRSSILPVVNDPATLASIVRARTVRHAVVSLPDMSSARLGEILDRYSEMVPHLLVLSDHSTLPTLWSTSRKCGQLSGIEMRNGLMLATLQFMKRVIDLTIALTALTLSFPMLLIIALVVKFSSPGPIFYGHSRIGRHGKRFKAWKFRTMHKDADIVLREHLALDPVARAEWHRDHKLRDDPRVTSFGRLARRLSLDELPQIWNVLKGDMSLVGPRPIVEDEIWRYGDIFRLYTTVKPGITGMWQVSGRNDIGYTERVLLDQFYIRHWSPWLDIYILAKTIVALLSRSGAY
ncbi:MAG: Undecaprenyl-phosphate galactose phosphotransferase, WbaP/exopolysaccharide biosynthesis polyprenyl [Phycisphaerales bacterium]|nr:Undecaprenyl-phosphate galactose phosphotransferase, WbaP/exopolysaccharide biosynthesis polyprenyl [Phycisphaerales bacterium]